MRQQRVTGTSGNTAADGPSSVWSPFRSTTFTVLWTATVVSNIGTWMYNAASGWLMTSLDPDPLIVSLVQVATTLPVFLVAIPAGALTDIVDRRRFLLVTEVAITVVSAIFLVTPLILLLFAFLIGVSSALSAPAWQANRAAARPERRPRPRRFQQTVSVSISAVRLVRRLEELLSPALESPRLYGSTPSAILVWWVLCGGGVLRKVIGACRPKASATPS
jgi:MFS family permease